jgi:hypothetical protein
MSVTFDTNAYVSALNFGGREMRGAGSALFMDALKSYEGLSEFQHE